MQVLQYAGKSGWVTAWVRLMTLVVIICTVASSRVLLRLCFWVLSMISCFSGIYCIFKARGAPRQSKSGDLEKVHLSLLRIQMRHPQQGPRTCGQRRWWGHSLGIPKPTMIQFWSTKPFALGWGCNRVLGRDR